MTDLATGAVDVALVSWSRRRRRLAGAAGSLGVSVAVIANLGKTPTQAAVVAMETAITGAPGASALSSVVSVLAAAKGVPPAALTAQKPVVSVANAAFALPGGPGAGGALAAVADAGVSTAGGAAGGAAGGVLVLLLSAYLLYSWRKHKKLPCWRDFAAEARERAKDEQLRREAEEMRRELGTVNPIGGGGGGKDGAGALTIRNLGASNRKLAEEAAARAAELEAFKAMVAAQVQAQVADKGVTLAATAKAPKREFTPSGV